MKSVINYGVVARVTMQLLDLVAVFETNLISWSLRF